MQKRDFKGVWIPAEIWLDKRLSALDKAIFTEINSLDGEKGCWASNDYIADFCQCSKSKVSRSIKKLCDLGFIYVESFNGRTRILRSCIGKNPMQDMKISYTDEANLQTINISSNIVRDNTPISPQRGEPSAAFDRFWQAYPRKVGKQAALKAFRKVKVPVEILVEAVEKQRRSSQWKKDNGQYIPNPATWLNQGRWEDEVDTAEEGGQDFSKYF